MSYSYIKNVFPNFEDSTKVWNDSLYNNIISDHQSDTSLPTSANIKPSEPDSQNNIVLPEPKLETYQNYSQSDYHPIIKSSDKQDNLTFYNLPISKEYLNDQYLQSKLKTIETFQNQGTCELDCDLYIKHINECGRCKSIVLKQFGIESDRIKNEEIMEVISYLIFGLFILLLIDSLKSK